MLTAVGLALALSLTRTDPPPVAGTPSAASPASRVEVPGLGLSYAIPAGWFSTPLNFDANLKKTGLSTAERQRILASGPRGTPLSSFQKYDPKKTAGLIPTINVIALPFGSKDPKQVLGAMKASTDAGGKTLADFAYVVEPRWVKVAGVDAVELVVTFGMPMPDGTKEAVRARSLAIPAAEGLIQVSFTEPASEKNDAVYRTFEQSITLTK